MYVIVHASNHQEMFLHIKNQCCAISYALLAMVLLFKLDYSLVTKKSLDETYAAGNKLYKECFGDNKSKAAFDFDTKGFELMGHHFVINGRIQEYSGYVIQDYDHNVT